LSVDRTSAEANIGDFLEKHGKAGFLKLLLTNYLFELVMYYLHSEKNPGGGIKEDTSYRFYVNGRERVYTPVQIERFKRDLRLECSRKADLIVRELENGRLIDKLTEDFIRNPEVAQLVDQALESVMRGK
jgi:hypothetical protein